MNNCHNIELVNENGKTQVYGQIPDLWHIAMELAEDGREETCEAILQVWHMAHDLKSCIENQGEARIVSSADFKQ